MGKRNALTNVNLIHQLRWRPVIGDPSVMGWMTVAAYGLCAITCLLVVLRARAKGDKIEFRIWGLVALLMFALCVNKQLDLQSLLTDIGRVIAWDQGWYQERRGFQKKLVIGVLLGSSLATGFLLWRFREFWRRHFLLGGGLVFLLTFIVVRAVSFHHVDMILKSAVSGVRINWFLELGGISLVWLAAVRELVTQWRKAR